jgi:hypothetical protein
VSPVVQVTYSRSLFFEPSPGRARLHDCVGDGGISRNIPFLPFCIHQRVQLHTKSAKPVHQAAFYPDLGLTALPRDAGVCLSMISYT